MVVDTIQQTMTADAEGERVGFENNVDGIKGSSGQLTYHFDTEQTVLRRDAVVTYRDINGEIREVKGNVVTMNQTDEGVSFHTDNGGDFSSRIGPVPTESSKDGAKKEIKLDRKTGSIGDLLKKNKGGGGKGGGGG